MANYRLRKLRETDAPSIAFHADNIKIWANVRDVFPHPYTLENAVEFIRQVGNFPGDIVLGIEIDDRVAGVIGLHSKEDVYKINLELGFWLGEQYWRKGIMTEAVNEILEIGFIQPGITRIYAEVYEHNKASARVLEKSGFKREAVLKQAIIKDGIVEDVYIFSMNKCSEE